jgi:hypothetical protein
MGNKKRLKNTFSQFNITLKYYKLKMRDLKRTKKEECFVLAVSFVVGETNRTW